LNLQIFKEIPTQCSQDFDTKSQVENDEMDFSPELEIKPGRCPLLLYFLCAADERFNP
jgi:hypothetical protein